MDEVTNSVPIAKFKSNKLSHLAKKHIQEELKDFEQGAMSPSVFAAVRMPNQVHIDTKKVHDHEVDFK